MAFTTYANQEIVFNSPHGTYSADPYYVDMIVAKYLPNSVNGLKAIAEEMASHTFDHVHSVMGFVVILADFLQASDQHGIPPNANRH